MCRKMSILGHPFDNMTCSMYDTMLQENDFRKRVLREDSNPKKRGTRGTCAGRKLGYLYVFELVAHS